MDSRKQKALEELNRRIEAGEEFPDIVFAIAAKWGLKERTLTKAYDEQYE